jgi:hypothetical protein
LEPLCLFRWLWLFRGVGLAREDEVPAARKVPPPWFPEVIGFAWDRAGEDCPEEAGVLEVFTALEAIIAGGGVPFMAESSQQ